MTLAEGKPWLSLEQWPNHLQTLYLLVVGNIEKKFLIKLNAFWLPRGVGSVLLLNIGCGDKIKPQQLGLHVKALQES